MRLDVLMTSFSRPSFDVGFLEDLQRLIVVRLRLSDDLKHLNRLRQLGFFSLDSGLLLSLSFYNNANIAISLPE